MNSSQPLLSSENWISYTLTFKSGMLFDVERHVKPSEFDRVIKVGKVGWQFNTVSELFSRLLSNVAGRNGGIYGNAGPRSEQLAVGSVFDLLTSWHDR